MFLSAIEATTAVIQTATVIFSVSSAGLMLGCLYVSGNHYRRKMKNKIFDACWDTWLRQAYLFPTTAPWSRDKACQRYALSKWVSLLLSVSPSMRQMLCCKESQPALFAHIYKTLDDTTHVSLECLESCITLAGLLGLSDLTRNLGVLRKHTSPPIEYACAVALVRLNKRNFKAVWPPRTLSAWSRPALLTFLKECSVDQVDMAIVQYLSTLDMNAAAQVLSVWGHVPGSMAARYGAKLLENETAPPPLLAAALKLQTSPSSLSLVRRYVMHTDWVVRLNAIKALGTLGYGDDRATIAKQTTASNWWLRTRAVQQLKEMDDAG